MGTLTLLTGRNLVRSDLNELTTTMLSDAELNVMWNDGYKDVAVKGLCYENKITKDNISISQKIITLADQSPKVIRVIYVEYKSGTTEGGKGILHILPEVVGFMTLDAANTPKGWFQWGDYLVVEPVPDAATYDLAIYAACYPSAVLSGDSDLCSCIPVEFHECVYKFTRAFACLKLKRWGDFAYFYNDYITDVQRKRMEFIAKQADKRASRAIPDNVEETRGQRG